MQLGGGTLIVGSGNASSTFSGAFSNTNTSTFEKTGSGTLTFGAGMNVSAGTLVLNGGTLNLGGYSSTFGSLDVTANSVIDFGTSGSSILNLTSLVKFRRHPHDRELDRHGRLLLLAHQSGRRQSRPHRFHRFHRGRHQVAVLRYADHARA